MFLGAQKPPQFEEFSQADATTAQCFGGTGLGLALVDTLNKGINAALVDPKMKARIADLGATVLPGQPADFGKLIAGETEKWAKVIRSANIKAE